MSTFQDLLTFTRGSAATYWNRLGVLATAAVDEPRLTHDPATLTTSVTAIDFDALTKGDSVLIDLPGSDTFAVGKDISVTDSSNINRYLTAVVEFSNPGSVQVTVKTINGTGSGSSWTLIENLGLQIEEQRTNLLLWSEDFSQAAWVKYSATVTASSEMAPDGVSNMQLLTVSDGVAIQQVKTLSLGVSYAVSGYAKKANSPYIICGVSGDCELRLDFDAKTLEAELPGNNIRNLGLVSLPNGVYKWSAVFDSSGDGPRGMRPISSKPGQGTLDAYAWGCQIEQVSTPSSYIKTEGAQVTRSADNCSRTLGAEFSDSEITVLWIGELGIGNFPYAYYIGQGSDQDRVILYRKGASTDPSTQIELLSTFGGTNLALATIPSGAKKVAFSYDGSRAIVTADGIKVADVSSVQIALNLFSILRIGNRAGFQFYTNGNHRAFNLYPRALSEAELIALTAPEA